MSHDKPEEEEILTMIMPRLSCGMFSSESCLMAMKFRSPGRAHRPHQHKQTKTREWRNSLKQNPLLETTIPAEMDQIHRDPRQSRCSDALSRRLPQIRDPRD